MKKRRTTVTFCYPDISGKVRTAQEFTTAVMDMMRKNGSIDYAGYREDEDLEKDLLERFEVFERDKYVSLSQEEKAKIDKNIETTVQKCFKTLPHPEQEVFVFVFPWFPDKEICKLMGGVNAVAVHECVMHLFLSHKDFTQKALTETVAHEYNHLVFYHYQGAEKYALIDHMVMEGLAEHFREDVVGGKPSPWATALTKKEAPKELDGLKDKLNSKNAKLHTQVLYGSKKYKRWTGYSIGYWMVELFKKKNKKKSWEDIIQTKTSTIFSLYKK